MPTFVTKEVPFANFRHNGTHFIAFSLLPPFQPAFVVCTSRDVFVINSLSPRSSYTLKWLCYFGGIKYA